MADLRRLAEDERSDLRDFVATLTPEQWDTPSLCEGWRVRDVVAHLVAPSQLSMPGMANNFLRARLSLNGFNDRVVAEWRDKPVEDVYRAFDRQVRLAGWARYQPQILALEDALIHHQDIRRPLGARREIPPERLVPVADYLRNDRLNGGRRRIRHLRLRATDIDWSAGDGPEVSGPAEALIMAMAGRPDALDDLHGEGAEALAARLKK
jgi:uncharacterized protein (TIGR03083 family)